MKHGFDMSTGELRFNTDDTSAVVFTKQQLEGIRYLISANIDVRIEDMHIQMKKRHALRAMVGID